MWPRRQALRALGASLALPALTPAFAQFRVEIKGVGATQIPIVLGRFRDEDRQPQSISAIVRADLERSGVFKIVDGPAPADENGVPDYPALRSKGADAVVSGSATRLADGKIDVRFRLWDVVKGADQGGQSEPTLPVDLRMAAHHVSDQIYQKLTGDRGIFSTRIAYVTKQPGKFTLRITDADGENIQAALIDNEPIISPLVVAGRQRTGLRHVPRQEGQGRHPQRPRRAPRARWRRSRAPTARRRSRRTAARWRSRCRATAARTST